MEENKEKKSESEPVKLEPRDTNPNPLLSIVKKISMRTLAWVGVYLLGYFDFSIAWMVTPLLLSVLRDHWKKEKRNRLAAAREAALSNEQAMLEARMNSEDLPSWVYFPDKERAEWINNIMKQLWPYVNMYVRNLLFETVEPAVESALKAYKLNPFKFDRDRVFLGQVPPRITGIKVYDTNVSRKEIILDVDLVFASDLEVVFKVKGIAAKVSDFGLRGMARIVLKPLISQIPLIGGVQVYFLKPPEIDYNLGGVANALEIPGVNKILERIIIEQIKNFIVLPNKFSMPLVANIPMKTLKCPDSAGVLRVKLIEAADLEDKDGFGSGKSDPYVIMTVGAFTHRMETVRDTCNPVWKEDNVFDFPIEVVHGQELLLEFYDDDDRKDDEFMGRARILTSVVAERGHIESRWIDLLDCEKGKVKVSLSWLAVTDDRDVVKMATKNTMEANYENHAKGLVHIFVDSVKGLVNVRDPSYKPSPRVRIVSNHERAQQSWPLYNCSDPVIEQGFVSLVKAPNFDEIRVEVIDFAKKDQILGFCIIRTSELMKQPGMEFTLQPWTLSGNTTNAQIMMSASLRGLMPPQSSPIKNPTKQENHASPEDRRDSLTARKMDFIDEDIRTGKVKLTIHQAHDLEAKDLRGKSDPYVVVRFQDQEWTTRTCKKTLDPVWDEEMFLNIENSGDNMVYIQVFDKDKIGKDEKIGNFEVDIRKIKQTSLVHVWDQLNNCKSGKLQWSAEFIESQIDPEDQEVTDVQKPIIVETIDNENDTIEVEKQDIEQESVVVADKSEEDLIVENVIQPELNLENVDDIIQPELEEENKYEDIVVSQDIQKENVAGLGYLSNVKAGFLKVTVHKAENLVAKDFGGKSDPYVSIRYDGQKSKSKHIKKDLNPVFEFTTGYVVEEDGAHELTIEVKDHDDLGRNESLGSCSFDLRQIITDGNIDQQWRNLDGAKSGRILMSIEHQGEGYNDVAEVKADNEEMAANDNVTDENQLRQRKPVDHGQVRINILYDENKEELKLFLHEVANLSGSHLDDLPDPYCKVYLMPGKKKKKKTSVIKDTVNPKFDEEFDFSIDIKNLQSMYLKIYVIDKKGVFTKSPVFGSVEIQLDNPGIKNGLAGWFPLEPTDEDSD